MVKLYIKRCRKPTLALEMNIPELVLTSLCLLSPDSLSATADLFSSDFAYNTIPKFKQIHTQKLQFPTKKKLKRGNKTHK